MSERVTRFLDFRTGQSTEHRSTLAGADFAERMRSLEAHLSDYVGGPVLASVRVVACDGCGVTAPLDGVALPDGWRTTVEGEFCPSCQ